jgi:hypothetical protein
MTRNEDRQERSDWAERLAPHVAKLLAGDDSARNIAHLIGLGHPTLLKVARYRPGPGVEVPLRSTLEKLQDAVDNGVPRGTFTGKGAPRAARPAASPAGAVQGMDYLGDRIVAGLRPTIADKLAEAISDEDVAALVQLLKRLLRDPPV